jgi:RHS repeat-associated protein
LEPYWGKPAVRNLRGNDGNLGIIRSPVRAIVLPDRQRVPLRSAIALTDSAGTIHTQYTYEPFSKMTASGQANANPYQFTGRENDGTGLYFYRACYYRPSRDSLLKIQLGSAAGLNFYGYVGDFHWASAMRPAKAWGRRSWSGARVSPTPPIAIIQTWQSSTNSAVSTRPSFNACGALFRPHSSLGYRLPALPAMS